MKNEKSADAPPVMTALTESLGKLLTPSNLEAVGLKAERFLAKVYQVADVANFGPARRAILEAADEPRGRMLYGTQQLIAVLKDAPRRPGSDDQYKQWLEVIRDTLAKEIGEANASTWCDDADSGLFAHKLTERLTGLLDVLRRVLHDETQVFEKDDLADLEATFAKLCRVFPKEWALLEEKLIPPKSDQEGSVLPEITAPTAAETLVDTRTHPALPNRPKPKAFEAFAKSLMGDSQEAIALQVYGDRKKQYQVSRDLKAVEKYLGLCGIPKDKWKSESEKPDFVTWDSEMIEAGKRLDGRSSHQRSKSEDSYG